MAGPPIAYYAAERARRKAERTRVVDSWAHVALRDARVRNNFEVAAAVPRAPWIKVSGHNFARAVVEAIRKLEHKKGRLENMMSNSRGIQLWAGEQQITMAWETGEGDSRLVGWVRDDGQRAIETNADPSFDGEEGFDATWEAEMGKTRGWSYSTG